MPSSCFPCCFCPAHTCDDPPPPPSLSPTNTINPNLTTYLYHTHLGFVSLTWSRSPLARSLHLHLQPSFHLHIKPSLLCKKHGVNKISPNTRVFWDLSKARFAASGPHPLSGFYVALVVDNTMLLLVGDAIKEAYSRTRARQPLTPHTLLLTREHVLFHKFHSTKAQFGRRRIRDIHIHCDDSSLLFTVDARNVLHIERLKWKFRGNERIELDGVPVHISWDVYNWLFDKHSSDGHAIFMFKFEEEEDDDVESGGKEIANLWMQNFSGCNELGKSFSSSSVSLSSSARSLGASSSVMEWASVEENELVVPGGFSLLIYAWKS